MFVFIKNSVLILFKKIRELQIVLYFLNMWYIALPCACPEIVIRLYLIFSFIIYCSKDQKSEELFLYWSFVCNYQHILKNLCRGIELGIDIEVKRECLNHSICREYWAFLLQLRCNLTLYFDTGKGCYSSIFI